MPNTLTAAVPTTAAAVKDGALNPTMDALAVADHKRRLIHYPETPEADSLIELLIEADDVIHRLGDVVVKLAGLHGHHVDFNRRTAGFADRLVTALHDYERNHPESTPPSGRRLAHRLIPLLDALGDPLALEGQAPARKELHGLFASVPRDLIFRDAVYDHLGVRRRPLLDREYERWEQSKSARKRGRR